MSKKVILHSKKGCIACNRVIYLLDKLEIPHEIVYDKESNSDISKFPVLDYGSEVFNTPISAADLYYIKKDLENQEESNGTN